MTIQNRIRAIRLAQKLEERRDFGERVGLSVHMISPSIITSGESKAMGMVSKGKQEA